MQDPGGATLVFEAIRGRFSRLPLVWADGLCRRVATWRPAIPVRLEAVERTGPGFELLPRRWVVERTFAWPGRHRRLAKENEGATSSREAFVAPATWHLMARRLARRCARQLSQHALRGRPRRLGGVERRRDDGLR